MTIMRAGLIVLGMALALAGCGNRRPLKPLSGHQLPPPAYGNDARPTADQLLKPRVQARPERSVDVRVRSEDRADDPFDLPPAN
jgi:hypothetical protein